MLIAVSPYHLTTREAPAMVSLLLADHVVTMLPVPFEGEGYDQVREAVRLVPGYLRFMETWEWSAPLWKAGVVGSVYAGEDAAGDVQAVAGRIETDERLATLRPLMRAGVFEDQLAYLETLTRDLLRGGPDPAVTVPLAAGLDRFAARHGMLVARTAPSSVVQRAEADMGRRVFSLAVPAVLQAPARRLLEVRAMLGPELEGLRAVMREVAQSASTDPERSPDPALIGELRGAAKAYADAFEDERASIEACEDPEDVRIMTGTVSLSGVLLPVDAVLRSSVAAAQRLHGRGHGGGRMHSPRAGVVMRDEFAGRSFLGLMAKVMGRSGR